MKKNSNRVTMNNIPLSEKVKISTTIHTDTRNISDNGMTETIVTRTITDHYADGTTTTRRETQSTREEELTPGGTVYRNDIPLRSSIDGPQIRTSLDYGNNYQNNTQTRTTYDQRRSSIPHSGYTIDPNSPKSDLQTDTIFLEEALACHNKYRNKHSVPLLSISTELCKVAQNWANQLSNKGAMENSHYGYGENIYWSSAPGSAMRGDVPVEYWYHEVMHFDWNRMDFQKSTGSFTQVVWKSTTQFGIAKSSSQKGTYVVAFYVPPGNVLGQFRENVFKAIY